MARFTVIVTRDTTESTTMTINARTAQDAQDWALAVANAGTAELLWEKDDNSPGEAYLTGCTEETPPEAAPAVMPTLETLALMAEVANHYTPDGTMRLMPAAGVADIIHEAIDRIAELEQRLGFAPKTETQE
jgi:hypothetical protein